MFPNISHFFGHVVSKSELFLLQPVRLPAILQVKPPELLSEFQISDDTLKICLIALFKASRTKSEFQILEHLEY